MAWHVSDTETREAHRLYASDGYEPKVKVFADDRRYDIYPSPRGHIDILPVAGGFLVMAERPPRREPSVNLVEWTPQLQHHCDVAGLSPWKFVQSYTVCDVIRSLEQVEQPPVTPFSPALLPAPECLDVVGGNRISVVERLAALVSVQRPNRPPVQLVGPHAVGRRTIAAALELFGFTCVGELPLGRLAIPRMLSTPGETINDMLVEATGHLDTNDMLVVSDAELLASMDECTRKQLIRELGRLPHVVLVSRLSRPWTKNIISLEVPGIEPNDAREWIASEYPNVEFVGSALDLLIRASTKRARGVLPGRLRHLVDLSQGLVHAQSCPLLDSTLAAQQQGKVRLAPDEVSSAIGLLNQPSPADGKENVL